MRWLAIGLGLIPSVAQALSCLPWGVSDAYLRAEAAEASYVPAIGTLRFDEDLMPLAQLKNPNDLPSNATIPATFSGHALVRDGADVPLTVDVTFEVDCVVHWCGWASSGQVIAFLRKDGPHYTLSMGPCGGDVFSKPDAAALREMRQCVSGQSCVPSLER